IPRQRARTFGRLSDSHESPGGPSSGNLLGGNNLSAGCHARISILENASARLRWFVHRKDETARGSRCATRPEKNRPHHRLPGLQSGRLPAADKNSSNSGTRNRGSGYTRPPRELQHFCPCPVREISSAALDNYFLRGHGNGISALARNKPFNGAAQAGNDALLPEHDHRFKQRRRHGLPHNRHARRVDQESSPDAFGRRQFAQYVVARIMVPVGERSEAVSKFAEHHTQPLILPEFLAGLRIVFKRIAEKCARPRRKIRQQTRAWPQQIHGLREPLAFRSGPFRLPEFCTLEFGLYGWQQIVGGALLQIIGVEPFGVWNV